MDNRKSYYDDGSFDDIPTAEIVKVMKDTSAVTDPLVATPMCVPIRSTTSAAAGERTRAVRNTKTTRTVTKGGKVQSVVTKTFIPAPSRSYHRSAVPSRKQQPENKSDPKTQTNRATKQRRRIRRCLHTTAGAAGGVVLGGIVLGPVGMVAGGIMAGSTTLAAVRTAELKKDKRMAQAALRRRDKRETAASRVSNDAFCKQRGNNVHCCCKKSADCSKDFRQEAVPLYHVPKERGDKNIAAISRTKREYCPKNLTSEPIRNVNKGTWHDNIIVVSRAARCA